MLCPAPPANQPPSPDGKPPLHEVLQPIASYVEAHLTPAQLAQLERDWQAYQAAVLRGREARLAAATSLQYGAALHSLSWQKQATTAAGGSTAERSQVWGRGEELQCAGAVPLQRPPVRAHAGQGRCLQCCLAATSLSPPLRAQAFTLMADGTGCLDSLGTEEMLAMVELQARRVEGRARKRGFVLLLTASRAPRRCWPWWSCRRAAAACSAPLL